MFGREEPKVVFRLSIPKAGFLFDEGGALPVPGCMVVLAFIFLAGGATEFSPHGPAL